MPESQNNNNNNDIERRCEYLFNITEFIENERPCSEYKIVVNEPVYKAKTETTEVVIDKDTTKVWDLNTKRKKRNKKDSGDL